MNASADGDTLAAKKPITTEQADTYLEATGEFIVIRRKSVPKKSEGGWLHLPDTARAKMEPEFIGVVTSVGPDVKKDRYVAGDRILYSHNFPMNIPGHEDHVYALVHQTNIMSKVHDESIEIGGKPRNAGLRSPEDPVEPRR